MRSERYESHCLFALIPLQDFPHRTAEVIVPESVKDPSKIPKRLFVRFQESLLRCPRIGSMISPSARHTPAGEDLRFLLFVTDHCPCLIPVDLCLLSPGVGLRNIDFTSPDP